jgi:hypothetical protein
MPFLSSIQVKVESGKVQIHTKGKDFLIRKFSPFNLTLEQQQTLNNQFAFDSGYCHSDLESFDSKCKSGYKFSSTALPADGTILYLLISVF